MITNIINFLDLKIMKVETWIRFPSTDLYLAYFSNLAILYQYLP